MLWKIIETQAASIAIRVHEGCEQVAAEMNSGEGISGTRNHRRLEEAAGLHDKDIPSTRMHLDDRHIVCNGESFSATSR